MVKELIIRITASNLWCGTDYVKYPDFISNNLVKNELNINSVLSNSDIMSLLTKPDKRLRDKTGKKQYHTLAENVYGVEKISSNTVKVRGINLFKLKIKGEYLFSKEGKELISLYLTNSSGDAWKIKLAEIILKYEIRTRLLFFYSQILEYKMIFPKKSKFKYLQNENEKLFVFFKTKKAIIVKIQSLLSNSILINLIESGPLKRLNEILKYEFQISQYFPENNEQSYENYLNLKLISEELEKLMKKLQKRESVELKKLNELVNKFDYITITDLSKDIDLSEIELDFDKEFEFVFNELLNRHLYSILGPFLRDSIAEQGVLIDEKTLIKIRGGGGSSSKSMFDEPSALKNSNVINYTFKLFEDINLIYRENDKYIVNTKVAYNSFPKELLEDLFINAKKENLSKEQIFLKSLCKNYKLFILADGFIKINSLMNSVCDDMNVMAERKIEFSRMFWKYEKKYYNIIEKKIGLPIYGEGIDPEPNIRLYKLEFVEQC